MAYGEYFIQDRKCGRGMQKLWGERMAGFLKDERLVKGFTLKWEVGCRYLELP
jgi:hypothetical protein